MPTTCFSQGFVCKLRSQWPVGPQLITNLQITRSTTRRVQRIANTDAWPAHTGLQGINVAAPAHIREEREGGLVPWALRRLLRHLWLRATGSTQSCFRKRQQGLGLCLQWHPPMTIASESGGW
ncbi:hypothetical protein JX265_006353 [Neoarthrinium moseri]|uniref:Uncharacterized protein n=1 Tax=Neoarthrinium moseri TaxID=1658444 RepID=A0A9Q0AM14_9PEZI|nr:hypothetical protein JX266_002481 [Neoarthrinium moseri]KAI1870183.1 hypothetical protein JX265_006353 [Neoarthrinium moseri]